MMDDAFVRGGGGGGRRQPDWSSLPGLAVVEIATRLNPIQFVILRSVCKSWRSACLDNKAGIVAKLPPMLLCLSCSRSWDTARPRLRPACQLHSFPDNITYVSPLPPQFDDLWFDDLRRDYSLCGYSDGYIISCGDAALHFANPFIRDLFSVPLPKHMTVSSVAVLDSPRSPSCFLAAFVDDKIFYCHLRYGEVSTPWSSIFFLNLFVRRNVTVLKALWFKGLLYCLSDANVFVVELQCTPPRVVKTYDFKMAGHSIADYTFLPCMLANENEILLLDLTCVPYDTDPEKHTPNKIKAYRLQDPERGNWELLDNVGGRTLFGAFYAKQGNGYLPHTAELTGFEHEWSDRVLFTDHGGCSFNCTEGRLCNENEHPSNSRWSRALYFAWASPSVIC